MQLWISLVKFFLFPSGRTDRPKQTVLTGISIAPDQGLQFAIQPAFLVSSTIATDKRGVST